MCVFVFVCVSTCLYHTHNTNTQAGISLWRIIQDATSHSLPGRNDPFSQEWFWWAILFGPLGCYGRYYLSRYNGKLSGDWKWFPLGTFIANIAACVVDYVMKVVPVRVPLERWDVSSAVLLGVVAGVGGCLSTVSTWVVEVRTYERVWFGFIRSHLQLPLLTCKGTVQSNQPPRVRVCMVQQPWWCKHAKALVQFVGA